MSAITEIKPFKVMGVTIYPPLSENDSRRVLDFAVVLVASRVGEERRPLPDDVLADIARAYQREYPDARGDSSAYG
ncbi:MAG TPA: hypothetical protein VF746_31880 [Longimicrobium sp.]|jgi:hypothetical protein